MYEKVDSLLIIMPDDIFSSLSELLAFVMSCEVSWMNIESLFLSDSFLLLEKGIRLSLEVLLVSLFNMKIYWHWRMTAFPICLFRCLRTKKLMACMLDSRNYIFNLKLLI